MESIEEDTGGERLWWWSGRILRFTVACVYYVATSITLGLARPDAVRVWPAVYGSGRAVNTVYSVMDLTDQARWGRAEEFRGRA